MKIQNYLIPQMQYINLIKRRVRQKKVFIKDKGKYIDIYV